MGSVADHISQSIGGTGSVADRLIAWFGSGRPFFQIAGVPTDAGFLAIYGFTPGDGAPILDTVNDHFYIRHGVDTYVDIGPGGGGGGGAPTDAQYLTKVAHAGLSNEHVVGATPGGELSGTWDVPTVDATHSGSSHAGVVTTHEGAADPHAVYQKESEKGAVNGYAGLDAGGVIPDAQIPAAIARDSELHAQNHADAQHTDGPNSKPGHTHSHDADLTGVSADDHHDQSHTHGSHTGIGVNDHHNESHAISSHTSFIISRGGTVIKSDGVAAINVIVWRAPYACTVTNVRGYRVGGTGATINARRNNTDNHLAAALSLTSADQWMDGGAVQNTAYVAGDEMEIMVASAAGSPTQIAIQVELTRP